MAGIPLQVIDSIKKFKDRISSDFRIIKIIIFGSYSKGTFNENSDIDLCIIVENVENPFLATLKIAPKVIGIDLRIEPLVFSLKDYEENSNFGILKEIKEKGIEISSFN
ncbi:MAG TPA: nucleotidyltransferase domain-containing protein [Ignavibacteriaceae bacterium]|jgi:predicted nucleotidyltransferase|nr:nucleotidyltransferase domain-containing protein [Ignavibacteriaceae bacterium]